MKTDLERSKDIMAAYDKRLNPSYSHLEWRPLLGVSIHKSGNWCFSWGRCGGPYIGADYRGAWSLTLSRGTSIHRLSNNRGIGGYLFGRPWGAMVGHIQRGHKPS